MKQIWSIINFLYFAHQKGCNGLHFPFHFFSFVQKTLTCCLYTEKTVEEEKQKRNKLKTKNFACLPNLIILSFCQQKSKDE